MVFHTGDFKIDQTPIEGEPMDLARIAELGNKGILLLMSDSTNVERPGYTMSERVVGDSFDNIFRGEIQDHCGFLRLQHTSYPAGGELGCQVWKESGLCGAA